MLKEKRIIVTGAARGLGRAIAEALVKNGAQVVIADILEDQGLKTAAELSGNGNRAHFAGLDLANPKSIENCTDRAISLLGGLDGLVNNGAIATAIGGKTMEEIDIDTWDQVMTVNVRGTWLMTRAASPALRQSASGSVVNVASDTAMWGAPRLLHYVASKGAMISMTRSMSRELGTDSVTVNAIAPGLTVVEATEYVPEERHRQYLNGRAIARQQMPEDVTGSVVFLLSEAARFVTGQYLPVNGGFTMN